MRALQEAVLPEVDDISAGDLVRHVKAVTGQSYVEVGCRFEHTQACYVVVLSRDGALRNC